MAAWTLIDTLNTISIFFLCLFSLFLIVHTKGKPISNKILGIFLLFWAATLLGFVLSRPQRLPSYFLPLFLVINVFDFLLGPLLYFYVRSVAYKDFVWRRRHLTHVIPAIFYVLFLVATAIVEPGFLADVEALKKSTFGILGISYMIVVLSCQFLLYPIASLLVLRSYRSRICNSYSYLEKINLNWLIFIITGFGLIWLVGIVNQFISVIVRKGEPSFLLGVVNMLIAFGVASLIVLRGLEQPEIFSGIEEKPKYEKSTLTEEEADRLLLILKNHMDVIKPYLMHRLNINGLAKDMAVSPRHISQVINSRLNKNFLNFINLYRVEEAKHFLSESRKKNMTILEIAYESGFNSKSVFNKAFKKYTGVSPVDYRKKKLLLK